MHYDRQYKQGRQSRISLKANDGLVVDSGSSSISQSNGMDAPTRTASMCQSGSVTDHLNREGRPHEGYDDRR